MNAAGFWSRVDVRGSNECWLWQGPLCGQGYGHLNFEGARVKAHRLAWVLTNGAIPIGMGYHGICVCHHCDVPRCCNPAHLFLGSHADNMADMVKKGRAPDNRGEKNPNCKLSAATQTEIGRLRIEGATQLALAEQFGVTQVTIGVVCRSVGVDCRRKLTVEQARELVALREAGASYYSLATRFEVSRQQVRRLCLGFRGSTYTAAFRERRQ